MFLKRMVITGFKTFAKVTNIDFTHPVSCIVGPNGSGKSNVIDAIRWVLFQRSNKALRAKETTEVIFHGSENNPPAKFAEVSLFFDNTSKILHLDAPEICVTKKITREGKVTEYFINGQQCLLKDVLDIFLDSGLNSKSLCVIGQNTVSSFVDGKPEERRKIFEEAANIGLYLTQKQESNHNLEKVTENYIRKSDLVNEAANEIKKLSKQAEKAKICSEKKNELTRIELTIFAKDINYNTSKLQLINNEYDTLQKTLDTIKPEQEYILKSIDENKEKLNALNTQIDSMTSELSTVNGEFIAADSKKTQLLMGLESATKSDDIKNRIASYQSLIEITKNDIENYKDRIKNLTNELEVFGDASKASATNLSNCKEKVDALQFELAELRFQIQNLKNSHNYMDGGVRTILENKNMFHGFRGLVKDFIEVDDKYQQAIYAALGRAVDNVVIDTEYDTQHALQILKENKSGSATFLSLDIIKPRNVREEYYEVMKRSPGFLGIANQLIKYPKQYELVYQHLLGSTIIADTISNAIAISKMTYSMFRIYSLDGDVINAGGSITGGYSKHNFGKPKISLEELEKNIAIKQAEFNEAKLAYDRMLENTNENSTNFTSKTNLKNQYEDALKGAETKLYTYEMEYKQYEASDTGKAKDFQNMINDQVQTLSAKCDKLNAEINNLKQQRMLISSNINDNEEKLLSIRSQMDKCRESLLKIEGDKVNCENILNNAKDKINNEYKLTLEFVSQNYKDELPMSDDQARAIIIKLHQEIDMLGEINWEAIKELDNKQKQYDEDVKVLAELKEACEKIREYIKKLDKQAHKEFNSVLENVNSVLPKIFNFLFGGGKCEVALSDPSDFLNAGIEILPTLPGKLSASLNLLSGGEKSLVAIAILFAILEYKSFPLIILDETESALDFANVWRYAKIIKSYSKNVQFIVVSHKAPTMEESDVLYGVTHAATGVSNVYKISIEEGKKLVGKEDEQEQAEIDTSSII